MSLKETLFPTPKNISRGAQKNFGATPEFKDEKYRYRAPRYKYTGESFFKGLAPVFYCPQPPGKNSREF